MPFTMLNTSIALNESVNQGFDETDLKDRAAIFYIFLFVSKSRAEPNQQ